MSPHLPALLSAISFSLANIAVRQRLKYSTPITATLVSLIAHTFLVWIALFLFEGGIPEIAPLAILAITITAVLQPVMRLCHYIGMEKVGASRAVTLCNTFPILSVIIGITVLRENITMLGILGALSVVLASGPVVLVSPITATTPIWTLLLSAVFLRDVERLSAAAVTGTLCVVIGVIALSLVN